MTTTDLVIFAHKIYDIEEHTDLLELLTQKIESIDYETIREIHHYYKTLNKEGYNYDQEDLNTDMNNIYVEFKEYFTQEATNYLIKKGYISLDDLDTIDISVHLANIDKELSRYHFDTYRGGYDKHIKNDIYYMIPEEYRTIEFFQKLVDIKIEYFTAIYPKFEKYTELCIILLNSNYNIFTYIPYKYVTLEMLQIYIGKSTGIVDISNYSSIITDSIIIDLFTNNRLDTYVKIQSTTVIPKLFEIDYLRCYKHYDPEIHGIDLIPKFIEKQLYNVLRYTEYITFDMVKDIPNLYDVLKRTNNYWCVIKKSYEDFIRLDSRFASLYLYSICEYDHLFKDNLDLVTLTLECDIDCFVKVAPYVTFDIVKHYVDNGKLDIIDITYLNIELQTKIAKYILETTPEKYSKISTLKCIPDILTEELVEHILDKDISLYKDIPAQFKNRENSVKYLKSPRSLSWHVPPEILELIGGKSACKVSK